MNELPHIKVIDNNYFVVFANKQYSKEFLCRLCDKFLKQRMVILNFFHLSNYFKVRINLFDNINQLNLFSSKYIEISPYHKGDCCGSMINFFCDDAALKDNAQAGYIIASLAHEFVHMVYHDTIHGTNCVWLEEGLATYLSEQKGFIERNFEMYKKFLKKLIYEKEIPKLKFLHKRGGKYGEFVDTENNKYDGYNFSYALVRFLLETKGKEYVNQIIYSKALLEKEEKILINEFLIYAEDILKN